MPDFDLAKGFGSFQQSAWRLITLPAYDVSEEADAWQQWREHRRVAPRTDGWLDLVRDRVAHGREMGRVHVVQRPLSEYTQWSLAVYAENTAAGESIRVADRSVHPELAELVEDFWIFDGRQVAVMIYDQHGRWLRAVDRSDQIERYTTKQTIALRASQPLDSWTANAVGQ